jgi:hypothetical protein
VTPVAPLCAAAVRRRFVVLTALRWLPTGLLIPVLVVFEQSRGLTLAQVGLVSATAGVVVLLLELPTGGLADALGRRPVLVAATALDLASLGLLVAARSPGAFMAAAAVQGVYRALDSGPLEAWYVDASLTADPRADIERGLARAGTAIGAAISAGALLTAAITAWMPAGGPDPLLVPVLAAIALRVVDLAALAGLLHEPRRREPGLAAAGAAAAGAPAVVGRTVRLVAGSPVLIALVAVEVSWGAGLSAVELFSGPRMVALNGDTADGVAGYALAAAAGWAVSGLGSALTGRVTAATGGSPARVGAWLRIVQGAGAAVMAVAGGPGAFVAAYLGFYLVHGTANVVHYGMVHRAVGREHRTTVLSANSLAARLGGVAAGLGLGAVADRSGTTAALLVAAVVLAAAAPLYGVARRSGGDDARPGEGAAGRRRGRAGDRQPHRSAPAPANVPTASAQNTGRSAGLRLVTRVFHLLSLAKVTVSGYPPPRGATRAAAAFGMRVAVRPIG